MPGQIGRREALPHIMIPVQSQADLLEVVGALGTASRLAGTLHGGEEQRRQQADDGDDDQQFDQREAPAGWAPGGNRGQSGDGS